MAAIIPPLPPPGINSFPTIKYFAPGAEGEVYRGGHDFDSLHAWLYLALHGSEEEAHRRRLEEEMNGAGRSVQDASRSVSTLSSVYA